MSKEKSQENASGKMAPPMLCGIIMPISPIDGCTAEHWSEVKQIIQDSVDSINEPKFEAKLVSDADDIGVIQKRIVQGVYNSDIVVCDVSAKNSNVMFELGMRLAFDKPTVIIKDDKTDYSFDTSIIEHISYPRDLRFSRIVEFKRCLSEKICATYLAAKGDPNHSTFLKNFGTFKVAQLRQEEASKEDFALDVLSDIQRELSLMRQQISRSRKTISSGTLVNLMVQDLIQLKKSNTKFAVEPSGRLVDLLLKLRPEYGQEFPSMESFKDALSDACDIANLTV